NSAYTLPNVVEPEIAAKPKALGNCVCQVVEAQAARVLKFKGQPFAGIAPARAQAPYLRRLHLVLGLLGARLDYNGCILRSVVADINAQKHPGTCELDLRRPHITIAQLKVERAKFSTRRSNLPCAFRPFQNTRRILAGKARPHTQMRIVKSH